MNRGAGWIVRLLGMAALVAFWVWQLADPDVDPYFRGVVLTVATVGMVAAQQPWLKWLRLAGVTVVVWPVCMLITALLGAAVGLVFVPGETTGSGEKEFIAAFLVVTFVEAVILGTWVLPSLWRRWVPSERDMIAARSRR